MRAFLFSLLVIASTLHSAGQNWQWARTTTGDGDGNCMASDIYGNVYISGETGGMIAGNYTLGATAYYIKYDPSGNIVWAKNSSSWNGIPTGASADIYGNSYFTGSFSDTLTIDTYTLTSAGVTMFLIKFDAGGNVVWAKKPTTGENYAFSVSNDSYGNSYVTGFYDSTCVFGNYTLTANPGASHAFLAKFDPYGNVVWADGSNSTSQDMAISVASDVTGNTYITGRFSSPLFSLGNCTLSNSGNSDFFIAKYDPNGTAIWARSGSGSSDEIGTSVCLGQNSQVYVAGDFFSPVLTIGNNTLYCPGGNKFFLAQYDANGNNTWARANSGGDALVSSISSYIGSVFVTGPMSGSITVGAGTINPAPASYDPAYLIQVGANGNFISGYSFKSGGDDYIGVSTDNQCSVFLSGDFATNNFILGNDTLTLTQGESLFVAKLSYSCQVLPDGLPESSVFNPGPEIFPNPNSGTFKILSSSENTQMIIVDYTGRKVHEEKLSAGENNISTILPEGLYFYRISESSGKTAEGKIIIR